MASASPDLVTSTEVGIVGAGIGGLTLALELQAAGIECRIFEAAPELAAVGVGINVLPHASQELARLGLEAALASCAISTERATFYNRFGQLIYEEPLGRAAGYEHPQFSIHRGDLQEVLRSAFEVRGGEVECGRRLVGFTQDDSGVDLSFEDPIDSTRTVVRVGVAVGCDGIHSVVRRQLHPEEGAPRYSGMNMWRGVTRWSPVDGGATMVRAGWLKIGKLVIYPIRHLFDGTDHQLVNWVAEVETDRHRERDWNRPGAIEDFIGLFEDWHFDWLDVPALLRSTEVVLEYPMVDQDPLDRWSFGRVTLLGDAAHPMVPRGSNGAGQAVLDARALTDALFAHRSRPDDALVAYEQLRLDATSRVVLVNRVAPPDAILGLVYERTGDQRFEQIADVISPEELRAVTDRYKEIAGYSIQQLSSMASVEASQAR